MLSTFIGHSIPQSPNPNALDPLPPFAGGGRLAGNGVAGSTDPSSGLEAMAPPRPVPSLADVLLEEIFVRIDSPADLARASTACVAFHRLITDPSFLRRYRSLHPPLLLGFFDYDGCGFRPPDEAHPSAALARAIARTTDLTFNGYYPRAAGAYWQLWDIRDGRVLFRTHPEDDNEVITEFAVCDPLARRCLLLPPIPNALLASVQVQKQYFEGSDAALVPSGEEDGDTSFRVIARMDFIDKVVAFVFSSDAWRWSVGTSISWYALSLPRGYDDMGWFADYAYGCFYWKFADLNGCLKLDMSSMEFSIVDLLPGFDFDLNFFTIVEAGEGRLGIFTLTNNDTSLCYCTVRQNGCERSDQLNLGDKIPLPVGHCYSISAAHEGNVFISTYQYEPRYKNPLMVRPCAHFFVETKTLKVERVCQRFLGGRAYFGFPPSMSQRRI